MMTFEPDGRISISETLSHADVAQALTTFVLRKNNITPSAEGAPPNPYEAFIERMECGSFHIVVESVSPIGSQRENIVAQRGAEDDPH